MEDLPVRLRLDPKRGRQRPGTLKIDRAYKMYEPVLGEYMYPLFSQRFPGDPAPKILAPILEAYEDANLRPPKRRRPDNPFATTKFPCEDENESGGDPTDSEMDMDNGSEGRAEDEDGGRATRGGVEDPGPAPVYSVETIYLCVHTAIPQKRWAGYVKKSVTQENARAWLRSKTKDCKDVVERVMLLPWNGKEIVERALRCAAVIKRSGYPGVSVCDLGKKQILQMRMDLPFSLTNILRPEWARESNAFTAKMEEAKIPLEFRPLMDLGGVVDRPDTVLYAVDWYYVSNLMCTVREKKLHRVLRQMIMQHDSPASEMAVWALAQPCDRMAHNGALRSDNQLLSTLKGSKGLWRQHSVVPIWWLPLLLVVLNDLNGYSHYETMGSCLRILVQLHALSLLNHDYRKVADACFQRMLHCMTVIFSSQAFSMLQLLTANTSLSRKIQAHQEQLAEQAAMLSKATEHISLMQQQIIYLSSKLNTRPVPQPVASRAPPSLDDDVRHLHMNAPKRPRHGEINEAEK